MYINSTDAGGDIKFIVLADDQPIPYIEHDAGPDIRRIEVAFPSETSEIMVIGTEVVPEFGAAALALLAVGGAVAVSRLRTRISP